MLLTRLITVLISGASKLMASIENSPKVKKKKESKEGKEKKKSEKDEWHVKTLDEIMEEKRRRKEQKGG